MSEDSLTDIRKKIAKYCAYRERCSKEVQEKLSQLGATPKQEALLIKWLKEEKYLDNSRFAVAFVRGKFSNNHWGKQRLSLELKARNIDQQDIRKALEEINTNDYLSIIEKLARKKWGEIKETDRYKKEQKTIAFLVGKGYEMETAWDTVKKMQ